ncbi:hypothetical protein PCE1_000194 [Barthelona sp. PCE]
MSQPPKPKRQGKYTPGDFSHKLDILPRLEVKDTGENDAQLDFDSHLVAQQNPKSKKRTIFETEPRVEVTRSSSRQAARIVSGQSAEMRRLSVNSNESARQLVLINRSVWIACREPSIRLFAPKTGKQKHLLPLPEERLYARTLCSHNDRVVVGGSNGSVYVFHPRTYKLLDSSSLHNAVINTISSTPHGLFTGSQDWSVRLSDQSLRQLRKWQFQQAIRDIEYFETDIGPMLAVATSDGELVVHRILTQSYPIDMEPVWKFEFPNRKAADVLMFRLLRARGANTRNSLNLLFAGTESGRIYSFDAVTGTKLGDFHAHKGRVLVLCGVGPTVWSGGMDSDIKIWDIVTNELIDTCSAHSGFVYSLCRVGNCVWAGASDKTLSVWRIDKLWQPIKRISRMWRVDEDVSQYKLDDDDILSIISGISDTEDEEPEPRMIVTPEPAPSSPTLALPSLMAPSSIDVEEMKRVKDELKVAEERIVDLLEELEEMNKIDQFESLYNAVNEKIKDILHKLYTQSTMYLSKLDDISTNIVMSHTVSDYIAQIVQMSESASEQPLQNLAKVHFSIALLLQHGALLLDKIIKESGTVKENEEKSLVQMEKIDALQKSVEMNHRLENEFATLKAHVGEATEVLLNVDTIDDVDSSFLTRGNPFIDVVDSINSSFRKVNTKYQQLEAEKRLVELERDQLRENVSHQQHIVKNQHERVDELEKKLSAASLEVAQLSNDALHDEEDRESLLVEMAELQLKLKHSNYDVETTAASVQYMASEITTMAESNVSFIEEIEDLKTEIGMMRKPVPTESIGVLHAIETLESFTQYQAASITQLEMHDTEEEEESENEEDMTLIQTLLDAKDGEINSLRAELDSIKDAVPEISAKEVRTLQLEYDDALDRLAAMKDNNEQLKAQATDKRKLEKEVRQLNKKAASQKTVLDILNAEIEKLRTSNEQLRNDKGGLQTAQRRNEEEIAVLEKQLELLRTNSEVGEQAPDTNHGVIGVDEDESMDYVRDLLEAKDSEIAQLRQSGEVAVMDGTIATVLGELSAQAALLHVFEERSRSETDETDNTVLVMENKRLMDQLEAERALHNETLATMDSIHTNTKTVDFDSLPQLVEANNIISEKNSQISGMHREINALKTRCSQLEQSSAVRDDQQRNEVEHFQGLIASLRANVVKQTQDCSALREENGQLKREVVQLKSDILVSKMRTDVYMEPVVVETNFVSCQTDISFADDMARVDALERTVAILSDDLNRVESMSNVPNQDQEQLSTLKSTLSATKKLLEEAEDQLKDQKNIKAETVAFVNDRYDALLESSKNCENTLRNSLDDARQKNVDVASELSNTKVKLAEVTRDHAQLEADLVALKKRHMDELEGEDSILQQRLASLDLELSCEKNKIKQLESENSELKELTVQQIQQIDVLKQQNDSMSEDIKTLDESIVTLETECNDKDEMLHTVDDAMSANERIRKDLEDALADVGHYKDAFEKLTVEKKELETELGESSEAKNELELKVIRCEAEIDTLLLQASDVQTDEALRVGTLEQSIAQMRQEMDKKRDRIDELVKSIQGVQQELHAAEMAHMVAIEAHEASVNDAQHALQTLELDRTTLSRQLAEKNKRIVDLSEKHSRILDEVNATKFANVQRIEELEEATEDMKMENHSLSLEKQRLSAHLDHLQKQNNDLKSENRKAKAEIHNCNANSASKLDDLNGKLQDMEYECKALEQSMEFSKKRVAELEDGISRLKASELKSMGVIEELTAEKLLLSSELSDVKEKLSSNEADNVVKTGELENKLAAMTAELEKLNAIFDAAEIEKQNACEALDNTRKLLSASDTEVAHMKKQNEKLQKQCDTIESQCNDLQAQSNMLELERDSLNTKHDQLEVQIEKLSAEHDELVSSSDNTKAEYEEILAKYDELQVLCDVLKSERDVLQFNSDSMKLKQDELHVQYKDLISKHTNLVEENNGLKTQIMLMKSQYDELQMQQDNLMAEVAEKEAVLEVNDSNLVSMNDKIKVKDDRIIELQDMLEQSTIASRDMSEINEKLNDLTSEISERDSIIANLKSEADDALLKLEERDTAIEILNRTISDLDKCIEDLNKDLGVEKERFETAQNEAQSSITLLKKTVEEHKIARTALEMTNGTLNERSNDSIDQLNDAQNIVRELENSVKDLSFQLENVSNEKFTDLKKWDEERMRYVDQLAAFSGLMGEFELSIDSVISATNARVARIGEGFSLALSRPLVDESALDEIHKQLIATEVRANSAEQSKEENDILRDELRLLHSMYDKKTDYITCIDTLMNDVVGLFNHHQHMSASPSPKPVKRSEVSKKDDNVLRELMKLKSSAIKALGPKSITKSRRARSVSPKVEAHPLSKSHTVTPRGENGGLVTPIEMPLISDSIDICPPSPNPSGMTSPGKKTNLSFESPIFGDFKPFCEEDVSSFPQYRQKFMAYVKNMLDSAVLHFESSSEILNPEYVEERFTRIKKCHSEKQSLLLDAIERSNLKINNIQKITNLKDEEIWRLKKLLKIVSKPEVIHENKNSILLRAQNKALKKQIVNLKLNE